MANIRAEARKDDATRLFLVAIMNRYDLRPSDAGQLLCDIDSAAAKMGGDTFNDEGERT